MNSHKFYSHISVAVILLGLLLASMGIGCKTAQETPPETPPDTPLETPPDTPPETPPEMLPGTPAKIPAGTPAEFPAESPAEIPVHALFKYVKFDDGTYGYDFDMPLKYNSTGEEPLVVPADFAPKKHEFRAAWVSTIFSINFPLTASPAEYQREYNKILDVFAEWNMNALIFQVRPMLDAFYPSAINPWSQYLLRTDAGARQGTDPGWDPLEWMVRETHRRGLEYHAWFNPYRVTASAYTNSTIPGSDALALDAMTNAEVLGAYNHAGLLAGNNFAVLHPEYVYRHERRFYLDAGIPAVREHVVESIKEVITRYDIDAVHFDDYFYPYGADDIRMSAAEWVNIAYYPQYPETRAEREQWRRDNNTALIEGVKAAIDSENQKNNRAIQFGISPFGVWYRNPPDQRGSATGATAFTYTSGVYADTWKWVKDESIDYIVPQIYWSFDHSGAPYGELARWWASVAEGTHVALYTGHANYKHVSNGDVEAAWMNPDEVVNQLRFNRLYPRISGSVFFSYSSLLASQEDGIKYQASNNSARQIKEHYRSTIALVPPKPQLIEAAPAAPLNVARQNNVIGWRDTAGNNTRYYVVYRAPVSLGRGNPLRIISDPGHIIARVWREGEIHIFSDTVEDTEKYTYLVTAFNAAHIESRPVIAVKRLPSRIF